MGKIILFGIFPPPLHGLSAVTQTVYNRLQSMRFLLVKINTSPPTLKGGLYRFQRLPRVLSGWTKLAQIGRKQVLYITLSGGLGQCYDIGTVLLGRILKMDLVFHHHSMDYLLSKRWISQILFNIGGKQAVHIVLCEKMEHELNKQYDCKQILTLSNLALFPMEMGQKTKIQLQTIGFLSNITSEKGGWEVIKLARAIKENHWPIQILVGGPCVESDLSHALKQAEQECILQWWGPIYGNDKKRYWEEVDAFIFPTRYRNEAEPLVVWEALSYGVPVIAYDRGCIKRQIGSAGKVVPNDRDFVEATLEILNEWMTKPSNYKNVANKALEQYRIEYGKADMQWNSLLEVLRREG